MASFYSTLYQKRFYDQYPDAKLAVNEFLRLASNSSTEYEAYKLLHQPFLEHFGRSTIKTHLTDFDNPIFSEDILYTSLCRHD